MIGVCAGIAACSGDPKLETGQGGSGGSSTVSTGGGGPASSSSAGGVMDAGGGPLVKPCGDLCGYLSAVDCKAWPNCSTECVGAFNAPDECKDEFEAMIACWVKNQSSFTCTATQLIPPPECQALETAFNDCLKGAGSGAGGGGGGDSCPGQVCNNAEMTCSCKTPCGTKELKSACSLPDGQQTWTCSCYDVSSDVDTLLGTCTEMAKPCDNHVGCCAVYFPKNQ